MPKKTNKPKIIKLSSQNIDEIQLRLIKNTLNEDDRKIISTILTTYQWLSRQLQTARFSIRKLKSIFGFKTEKSSNLPKSTSNFSVDSKKTEPPVAPPQTMANDSEVTPLKKQ